MSDSVMAEEYFSSNSEVTTGGFCEVWLFIVVMGATLPRLQKIRKPVHWPKRLDLTASTGVHTGIIFKK